MLLQLEREQEIGLKSFFFGPKHDGKWVHFVPETRPTCQHLCPLPQVLRGHPFCTSIAISAAASTSVGHDFILNDLMLAPDVGGCGPFPSVQAVVLVGFFDARAEAGAFEGGRAARTSSLSKPV